MPGASFIKYSAVLMAIILLIIAVPFLLVQKDIISADWLRFEPATIAMVVALWIIIMALPRKRKGK
jgi:hypothetical protein